MLSSLEQELIRPSGSPELWRKAPTGHRCLARRRVQWVRLTKTLDTKLAETSFGVTLILNKTNMDHCRSCVLSEFAVFGLFPLSRLQVILLFFICAHYLEGFI